MSFLLGPESIEQQRGSLKSELEQMITAIQAAFAGRDSGDATPLLLGLEFENDYPAAVRDELEQMIAAIQAAFNAPATLIKSIQRGSITLGAASTTATIQPVDLDNSVIKFLGQNFPAPATESRVYMGRVELTNSTTVTGYVNTFSGAQVVGYEVIEYKAGVIKSVQRGTISLIGVSSATATLQKPVDPTRCSSDILGWTCTRTDASIEQVQPRILLTNFNTVTALANTAAATGCNAVGYQVVEWL